MFIGSQSSQDTWHSQVGYYLHLPHFGHCLPTRLNSTGSAGIISTIKMYIDGHLAAGILGTIATVGWSLQGVGNGFYFFQVRKWSRYTVGS